MQENGTRHILPVLPSYAPPPEHPGVRYITWILGFNSSLVHIFWLVFNSFVSVSIRWKIRWTSWWNMLLPFDHPPLKYSLPLSKWGTMNNVGQNFCQHHWCHPYWFLFSPPARWGLLDFMYAVLPLLLLLLLLLLLRLLLRLANPLRQSPRRTSTTTILAQCSLPDLNPEDMPERMPDRIEHGFTHWKVVAFHRVLYVYWMITGMFFVSCSPRWFQIGVEYCNRDPRAICCVASTFTLW